MAIPRRLLTRGRFVAQLKPATGPIAGGTAVTVCGTGFSGATGVQFGTTPGTAFVIVDDSTITVTAPAHAAGLVNATVQHPGLPALGSLAAGFTYV